jgi:hypothetical protein
LEDARRSSWRSFGGAGDDTAIGTEVEDTLSLFVGGAVSFVVALRLGGIV